MKNSKFKLTFTIAMLILTLILIPISSYATNDNIIVVKNADDEYLIYVKEYYEQKFEFAFSNNNTEEISNLTFIPSAVDNPETENNIAYINNMEIVEMFKNKTYMWIKVNDEIKVTAQEIEINDNITKIDLKNIANISKKMPIKLEQKQTVNEVNESGTKITETVGIVKLVNGINDGEYQLVKRLDTDKTDKLFALAEEIEKNEFANIYSKLETNKQFIELYKEQYNLLKTEEWTAIKDSTILQPNDAQTGEQFILWLKNGDLQDVHFLTSYRDYKEEYIKEEVTTKLPYTYDSAVTLIALGIVIIAIIGVSIRIIILKKKENTDK